MIVNRKKTDKGGNADPGEYGNFLFIMPLHKKGKAQRSKNSSKSINSFSHDDRKLCRKHIPKQPAADSGQNSYESTKKKTTSISGTEGRKTSHNNKDTESYAVRNIQ